MPDPTIAEELIALTERLENLERELARESQEREKAINDLSAQLLLQRKALVAFLSDQKKKDEPPDDDKPQLKVICG